MVKKIFSSVGFYLMLGMTFIGFIIFSIGFGSRNSAPNIYFILIGALLLLPFGIFFLYDRIQSKKENQRRANELIAFKKSAEKINVCLKDIEIKSNSWSEMVVTDESKFAGFNELSGNGHRNIKSVTTNLNNFIVRIPYQDEIIEYQVSVSMESTKLKLHLAIQEQTTFYIDPMDKSKMYLDLEFLDP